TAVVAAVGVVAAVLAVIVELFGGEFMAVARCSCSGVNASPFQPSSYMSGTLVGVVAGAVVAVAQLREWYDQCGASQSSARCPYIIRTGARAGQTCGTIRHTQTHYFSCLSDTSRAEFRATAKLPWWLELLRQGVDIFALSYDTILTTMYALTIGTEGDCSLCVLPDPGIETAALGASESALPDTTLAEALHTFTLDSKRCEPESRPASPICAVRTCRRVPRPRPPPIPGTHAMALHPSSAPLRVPLPPPPKSSLLAVRDPEFDLARAASSTVSRLLATVVTDPSFESTTASALVAELVEFAATCRLDYATALVAESESASPPSVAGECALGTDVLEDRQEDFSGVDYFQTFYPTPKMTTLRLLLHIAAQHEYELHSLDFRTTFLQGSLHEEIWLRRPPGFTESFPAGTQWSLRRPVYGLCQAPREWHDKLRTTLAALGLLLLLLPRRCFYAPTRRIRRSTSSCPSALRLPVLLAIAHSFVYRQLALSSTFGRVLHWAWGSCLEDGASCPHWSQRRLLELRWLTYLLTDLGEQPRSPPVLYVDNKAMIAFYHEHRLEHRTKHIALRYFLARELQQRGHLRLAYVATRANTADIFTKALLPGDHQRFSNVLGLVPTWPHLLTA
ncbi:unnamed protein product, partial [Closterium sp. NIES-53]